MNRIVHFEIPATDPEKSMAFYQTVFGWKFSSFGDYPYWLAETGDADQPGINGAIMQRRDPAQPMTNSIQVADVQEAIRAIEANGGVLVVPPTPMGTGSFAFFKDPDGNILGLWHVRAG